MGKDSLPLPQAGNSLHSIPGEQSIGIIGVPSPFPKLGSAWFGEQVANSGSYSPPLFKCARR